MDKRILLGLTCLLVILSSFFGTYGFLVLRDKYKAKDLGEVVNLPTPLPERDVNIESENAFNVLFLGKGGKGHAGGELTDSIIVLSADTANKKAAIISIPRDLLVPGGYKINAAAINVGEMNLGPIVQNVTGIKTDHFVSVDFGNFEDLIDLIGGVTVDNPTDYNDYYYPIPGLENDLCGFDPQKVTDIHASSSGFELEKSFPCRWEHLSFKKGPVNLDGKSALKFSRSRHGDSDFGRSARQMAVLVGISEKLISPDQIKNLDKIVSMAMGLVRTNLTLSQVDEIIAATDLSGFEIARVNLTTDNVLTEGKVGGAYVLYPKLGEGNFEGVKNYITERTGL